MTAVRPVYFPPLEQCLTDPAPLISWFDVRKALYGTSSAHQRDLIKLFVGGQASIAILALFPSQIAPLPTENLGTFDQTVKAAETALCSEYNDVVKEIRHDALWLVEKTQIGHVQALRLATHEYQTRTEWRLVTQSPDANIEQQRRVRLARSYISERRDQLVVMRLLCAQALDAGAEDALEGFDAHIVQSGKAILKRIGLESRNAGTFEKWLATCIDGITSRLQGLQKSISWFEDQSLNTNLNDALSESVFSEIIELLWLIFTAADSIPAFVTPVTVTVWFDFMRKQEFFFGLCASIRERNTTLADHLQGLCILCSVALLQVAEVMEHVELVARHEVPEGHPQCWFEDEDTAETVTKAMLEVEELQAEDINVLSPIVLGWSVVMLSIREESLQAKERREISQSEKAIERHGSPQRPVRRDSGNNDSFQLSRIENIADSVQRINPNEDLILSLAHRAADRLGAMQALTLLAENDVVNSQTADDAQTVLKARLMLLDLFRAAMPVLSYQSSVVEALLAIIQDRGNPDFTPKAFASNHVPSPAVAFVKDDFLVNTVLQTAILRFPYESSPLLLLMQAIAQASQPSLDTFAFTYKMLSHLPSITTGLDPSFASWTVDSYNDEPHLKLTSSVDVFTALGFRSVKRSSHSSSFFTLPAGSLGTSLSKGGVGVTSWGFEYAAFTYIGEYLRFSIDQSSSTYIFGSGENTTTADEMLALLVTLTTPDKSNVTEAFTERTRTVFSAICESFHDGQDAVDLIIKLFESSLQCSRWNASNVRIVTRCLHLFASLLTVYPSRIWPFLAKSDFLGARGEQRVLDQIMAANLGEAGSPFLSSLTRLYSALVDDGTGKIVQRQTPSNSLVRFKDAGIKQTSTGIPLTTVQRVLAILTRAVMLALQRVQSWPECASQSIRLQGSCCKKLARTLALYHGLDRQDSSFPDLTEALAKAVLVIDDAFMESSTALRFTHSLATFLLDGISQHVKKVTIVDVQQIEERTIATLRLSTVLVSAKADTNRLTNFETQLLGKAMILVQLYAVSTAYREPVLALLTALMKSAARASGEIPSLLGYLGENNAEEFCKLLFQTTSERQDSEITIATWKFFSGVIVSRQQWFAIYLLTGATPRRSVQTAKADLQGKGGSILPTVWTRLAKLTTLNDEELTALLTFLNGSIEFWPSVADELARNDTIIAKLGEFLESTTIRSKTSDPHGAQTHARRVNNAAQILNLFTILLHRKSTDQAFAQKVSGFAKTFFTAAPLQPEYNTSLHGNLRQNFETKYSVCQLSQFKHGTLHQDILGPNFYYNVDIAKEILSFDSAWAGKKGDGFAVEFERANTNLSIVESQMRLFSCWKSFSLEIATINAADFTTRSKLFQTIRGCVQANVENTLPEAWYFQLMQSRADLAFTLLQKLIPEVNGVAEINGILEITWTALKPLTSDLAVTLVGENALYARTLLKIIYIVLQPHATKSQGEGQKWIDVAEIVLEILAAVVASGFRTLVVQIHEDPALVLPGDIELVNGILQSCLRLPGIDQRYERLQTIFADDKIGQIAGTLFTWSHQLLINGDPVFAELSLQFLLHLSTVPSLAESLVLNGCLSQLASADILNVYRRAEGAGPFCKPPRLFSIWVFGLLPLLLNLLGGVGAPIAGDVSLFLSTFSTQFKRAVVGLDKNPKAYPSDEFAGLVTFPMASEIRSLVLLNRGLTVYKNAGASAGINSEEIILLNVDFSVVKEELDNRLSRRIELRSSIVPTTPMEEAWSKQNTGSNGSDMGAENKLERRVVGELMAAQALLDGSG